MITAKELRGIISPIITPLTPDYEVDVKALRRVLDYQLDGGVSAIFACGSSSEFPAMTFQDKRIVTQTIVEATRGRVPVLAGCAATGLREVIQHAKIAKALGADAIVVTPLYYFHYSPGEIVSFYRAVAKAAHLPVMVYNIPSSTGTALGVGTLLQLSEIPGVVGVKDSTGNVGPMSELLQGLAGRDDFAVFQGAERVAAVSVLMGAHGCVLGLANVHPRLCADLFNAAKSGNISQALRLQERMNDLFNLFRVMDPTFSSTSTVIAAMKTPLEIMGLCSRRLYPPATDATPAHIKQMKEILRRSGLKIK